MGWGKRAVRAEYCAFRMVELGPKLDEIEQFQRKFESSKDRQIQREANAVARRLMSSQEPHLACQASLWFESRDSAWSKSRVGDAWRDAFAAEWNRSIQTQISSFVEPLGLGGFPSDLTGLPPMSFLLRLPFTLNKPYISRDDAVFHILDNPLKTEWVFKVPVVAASSWKGALRSAMMREAVAELDTGGDEAAFLNRRLQLYRLFGNEKDGAAEYLNRAVLRRRAQVARRGAGLLGGGRAEEEPGEGIERKVAEEFDGVVREYGYREDNVEGFRGCLHFFPTFFGRVGLEVVNPHSRVTGAGTQPIYLECVPQGARGTFALLYIPLALEGRDVGRQGWEVAEDLVALAQGIRAMFVVYGFGAKTSSGFGTAEEMLPEPGVLAIRAALPVPGAQADWRPDSAPDGGLPRYLESPTRLRPDLRREDGSLKSEEEYRKLVESRGQVCGKKHRQLYEKACGRWEREGSKIRQEGATQREAVGAVRTEPRVAERTFKSFTELEAVAREVARALQEGTGV